MPLHHQSNPTYLSWRNMKQRCNNPNDINYHNYGGRGISYPGSWEEFSGFYADMGQKPRGLTLERKDTNANYSKENCIWATPKEQRANQRKQTKARVDSASGIRGVTQTGPYGYWGARVTDQGKRKMLYFGPSKEKAIEVKQQWDKEHP